VNLKRTCVSLATGLLSAALAAGVALAPRVSAQGTARPRGCNQAMADSLAFVEVPGHPFEPILSKDGCSCFVPLISANPRSPNGVAVLRRGDGEVTVVRVIPVEPEPTGMVLTHDGKLLVVADGDQVVFMDTARMVSGRGDPILGYISDGENAGSVYVNCTADDRYLFVSDEHAQAITVIDLGKARGSGFQPDAIVGKIPVGRAPIALTFSPDERHLYTTSQVAPKSYGWPAECKPEGQDPATATPTNPAGALIVVDVERAKVDPPSSIVARVPAGCSPVRLAISPAGDVAYVTARNSNAVLAFDTAKLLSDSTHALIATIPVGTAPVGVAVVDAGREVVVANSNRFAGGHNDRQSLSVIDAANVASGAGAVIGSIPAGGFPRELRVTEDGRTLVVSNFNSNTVEFVDIGRLGFARSQARRSATGTSR